MSGVPPVQRFEAQPGLWIGHRVFEPASTIKKPVPLVLIQGMSAVGTVDWTDLAMRLRAKRTVIAMDNRDIGESTWEAQEKSFTLRDLAQDVVQLIRHLRYDEVDIAGHSMGGMIAQTLITTPDLPIQIRHCILGATSAKGPRSDLGKAVYAQMKKMAATAKTDKRSREEKNRETTEVLLNHCYDEEWIRTHPELYERRVQESLHSRRPAATVQLQQRAIGGYDVRKLLPSLPASLPVLVIHGRRDVAVYPEEQDAILSGIRHAKLLKCPSNEFGHQWFDYFTLDFWEQEISRFLDDELEGPKKKAKL